MKSTIDWQRSCVLLVDPQVDVLAPEGAAWDLVGEQVTRLGVAGKLRALRDEAEQAGIPVFYAWLQVRESDYAAWNASSGLQQLMAQRRMMLPEAGGQFVPELAPTERTILLAPRRSPSPAHSDLALQLRQRGLDTVVVAGMIANLCVESHVRELTAAGFRAVVVEDAIAATSDVALEATLANFALVSSGTLASHEVLDSLRATRAGQGQVA